MHLGGLLSTQEARVVRGDSCLATSCVHPQLHGCTFTIAYKMPRLLPWVPEDIFFLSILMVRGEAASTSNRKHGLFHIRYFENGPLEPGYPTICMNDNFWIIYTFEGSVDWVYGQLGVKYSYAVSMQDRSGRGERFVYVEKGLLEGVKAFVKAMQL